MGVSAGVGVEAQWRRLRIAPRVRYTRWAEDALDLAARTRPGQLEFLAGFSYVPELLADAIVGSDYGR